jgi:ABC-2 type transport system permease protein
MRKILAIALKELRQSWRDPLTLLLLIGIPTGLLLLFGYAIGFDVEDVPLAVEDRDRSEASRRLIDAFVQSDRFVVVDHLEPGADIDRITDDGEARAVLVIPQRYGAELAAGGTPAVQLVIDGADANQASNVLSFARAIVADGNARLLRDWLARHGGGAGAGGTASGASAGPGVAVHTRAWFNPDLESTPFLVPGLIGFILMMTSVLATALSVVREKERGTMQQLRLTPLYGPQLIFGKTVPFLLISLAATGLFLLAADVLFDVPVRGPIGHLVLATLIYLLGGLGFGLLISTIAQTQAIAFQVGIVASMLPAIFLSGFIFPLHNMPKAVYAASFVVPARYYISLLRGIVLKGVDVTANLDDLLLLCVYTTAVITLATVRLARQEG